MKLAVAGLVVVLGIAVLVGAASKIIRTIAAEREIGPKIAKLRQDRVKAAAAVCTSIQQRADANEPLTPTFVDLIIRSRRTLAEVRADAGPDARARVDAWKEYHASCRRLIRILTSQAAQDVSKTQLDMARYAEIDAEYRVLLASQE